MYVPGVWFPRTVTSSNGNILRITGTLCSKSLVTGEFPSQTLLTRNIDVPMFNNRDDGNLTRKRAYYDVTIIKREKQGPTHQTGMGGGD